MDTLNSRQFTVPILLCESAPKSFIEFIAAQIVARHAPSRVMGYLREFCLTVALSIKAPNFSPLRGAVAFRVGFWVISVV